MLNLLRLAAFVAFAIAQDSSSQQSVQTLTGSDRQLTGIEATPTLYLSDFSATPIGTGSMSGMSASTGAVNASGSTSSSGNPYTQLVGGQTTVSGNATASTTTAAPAVNTQPCNNYPEFCTRKYSNITEVCAHNSPFYVKNNAGSNQALSVTQQLNDGVRMLQGQAHLVNGTLYYCHTSCDLLNAGTVESYLKTVTDWVEANPFDVITILFGNGDYQETGSDGKPLVTSSNFVAPIEKSGLKQYIYQPPKTAMTLDDWPTLGELILSGKRVITFIDYNFNTTVVPYILWEFYNIWETPFSPTDPNFPCTLQRPDGISAEQKNGMMYMANHNLNVEVSLAGISLLVPNTVELNVTNGLNGTGSLGLMTNTCIEANNNHPPNFLLVDYYNVGSFDGSVFEVAARANNVTYNRQCCGTESIANVLTRPTTFALVMAVIAALML
ncbi:PLC-like phosphodiesterase [Pleomassaria siparia CBS 279.74]|uniref:PLC-like phosphodiesterase n=1 Tax=Pleomassaria siparia CBS 279.74 TaxID=1314801 RepID=A0A6G1K2K1_9PLEO|nr:PLC-like phosphodiesterase [Pleomassaria siparia CBS 279.74]